MRRRWNGNWKSVGFGRSTEGESTQTRTTVTAHGIRIESATVPTGLQNKFSSTLQAVQSNCGKSHIMTATRQGAVTNTVS
jgi:hypothetical protein